MDPRTQNRPSIGSRVTAVDAPPRHIDHDISAINFTHPGGFEQSAVPLDCSPRSRRRLSAQYNHLVTGTMEPPRDQSSDLPATPRNYQLHRLPLPPCRHKLVQSVLEIAPPGAQLLSSSRSESQFKRGPGSNYPLRSARHWRSESSRSGRMWAVGESPDPVRRLGRLIQTEAKPSSRAGM